MIGVQLKLKVPAEGILIYKSFIFYPNGTILNYNDTNSNGLNNIISQFDSLIEDTITPESYKYTDEHEPVSAKEGALRRNRITYLLEGYKALMACPSTLIWHRSRESRVCGLLESFKGIRIRTDAAAVVQAASEHETIRNLLSGFCEATQKHNRQQLQYADGFNMLEVMGLVGKEIRHSMALAWLLDRDPRKRGTHAQGNLGFRLFLQQFRLPFHYADLKYWVRREAAGDDSIIDVEIACRGKFLIHIENKIWSSEGTDQTDREWKDVCRRAEALGLTPHDGRVHVLFLTPRGAVPANINFIPISWGRVILVLEEFAQQAQPAEVKLFATHYAKALRRFIVIQDIREDDDGQSIDG